MPAPRASTLYTYRKILSVQTHCLGNKKEAKTDTAKSETRKPGNYNTRKLEPWETKKPGDQETKLSGKRPQTVWGSGRIMYANVVDDDDDDDDDDGAEIYRRNAAPHTSPESFHTKKSQSEPLYPEICRKNAAPQSQPRTQTHTLCEPARSKCVSTFHNSHFILKFTGKMPAPRASTLIKHRPLHLP